MSAPSASDATNPFPHLPAIRRPDASPQPARPARAFPTPRFGDYSRTRFESRVAFGGPDEGEDAEEIATPTRQFSLLEITSGLPDDSREADERAAERRLRDLRGRVKAARAAISGTPGAERVLRQDLVKAAVFYVRFGITGAQFWHGVPRLECPSESDPFHGSLAPPVDVPAEARAREEATLPAQPAQQSASRGTPRHRTESGLRERWPVRRPC